MRERLAGCGSRVRQREHVRVELADRVLIRLRVDRQQVPQRQREARREERIEIVAERAVLQDLAHLLRLDLARAPGRIEHQCRDRRCMRRRCAGAEEVRERVRIDRRVAAEERLVGAVHRRHVRLLADLRMLEALVVLVEVDRRRSRRGERLRHERREERIGRDAHGSVRRVVTVGHRTEIAEVLLRVHAAEADVADAICDVAVLRCRRVGTRNDHLQRRCPASCRSPPAGW